MRFMKTWGKWAGVLLAACGGTAAVCLLMACLVYQGYVIPNNRFIGKDSVTGCDVSHYQGEIDWEILSKQDISFVFIKATEGSSHVDGRFRENWTGVQNTKLRAGAYHFFSFESSGADQARHFIRTVGRGQGMLPPVADIEFYGNYQEARPDPAGVRAELSAFLSAVEEEYQVKPVIYTTEEAYSYFIKGFFGDYPLWIRSVVTRPRIDRDWTFWQYTNRGQLEGSGLDEGSEKYIDRNVFWGTEEELDEMLAP